MTPEPERLVVFVNAERVEVARDATVLDAVRAWRASDAPAVEEGRIIVTDSRGLPTPATAALTGGAILRLAPRASATRAPHR